MNSQAEYEQARATSRLATAMERIATAMERIAEAHGIRWQEMPPGPVDETGRPLRASASPTLP